MVALQKSRGFTLLEVLIALLIFSLGLLGLAGLIVMSIKTNHSAYLRTQATFLAESMADRMRADSMAIWASSYNGSYPLASSSTDPCANGVACSSADIASRDKIIWSQQLKDSLPNVAATITCTPNAGIVTPTASANPPYNGLCAMRITWNESTTKVAASTGTQQQAFAWVFQP